MATPWGDGGFGRPGGRPVQCFLESVELEQAGPLEVKVSVWDGAQRRPCPYPELLLVSALNPEAGSARGTSLLRGCPLSARFC